LFIHFTNKSEYIVVVKDASGKPCTLQVVYRQPNLFTNPTKKL